MKDNITLLENVPLKYIKTILEQFKIYREKWNTKEVNIKFGVTGVGDTPNYQFETTSGDKKQPYWGAGNDTAERDEFDSKKLTRSFSFSEVLKYAKEERRII